MDIGLKSKVILTLSYGLSTLLSYLLMLVVMTFNGGLFLATIFGLSFGYFVFGFLKKRHHLTSKQAAGTERLYNPEGDKCCADIDYE